MLCIFASETQWQILSICYFAFHFESHITVGCSVARKGHFE